MEFVLCAFSDEAGASLDEQIAALKRNNIGHMEIRSVDGVNIGSISQDKAREYSKRLKESGIKVWSIGSPLGKIKITDDFGQHLELTRHVIELAKIFETDKIRMFSFYINDHKADRSEVIDRLSKMAELASQSGVTLCHENEKGIYGDMAGHVDDLLKSVKGLKSVFDTANFIQCGQDVGEAMDMLLDKAEYIHIKDAIYGTGEVVPAGMGDGMIEEILSRTQDKVLTLEPHLKIFSGYGAIDKHELKNRYTFKDNNEAFDAAAAALKNVLAKLGYSESGGKWVK